MSREPGRAGVVAVLGRPNVGKSSLVNRLVGSRIAIVSRRPQSTRRQILGVVNRDAAQIVLADAPGLHPSAGRALNRALNAAAREAAAGADALLVVAEAGRWEADDEAVLELVRSVRRPAVLALNKIDRIRERPRLLPLLAQAAARHDFAAVVPVSARRGDNLDRLAGELGRLMPAGPALFPAGQITDQSAAERAAETVRQALIERVGAELPYATFVTVERYEDAAALLEVEATVWVARESQKGIVIGAGGRMLKAVGTDARRLLEAELGRRVMLRLWVRVRPAWNEDPRALAELGLGGPA